MLVQNSYRQFGDVSCHILSGVELEFVPVAKVDPESGRVEGVRSEVLNAERDFCLLTKI